MPGKLLPIEANGDSTGDYSSLEISQSRLPRKIEMHAILKFDPILGAWFKTVGRPVLRSLFLVRSSLMQCMCYLGIVILEKISYPNHFYAAEILLLTIKFYRDLILAEGASENSDACCIVAWLHTKCVVSHSMQPNLEQPFSFEKLFHA